MSKEKKKLSKNARIYGSISLNKKKAIFMALFIAAK